MGWPIYLSAQPKYNNIPTLSCYTVPVKQLENQPWSLSCQPLDCYTDDVPYELGGVIAQNLVSIYWECGRTLEIADFGELRSLRAVNLRYPTLNFPLQGLLTLPQIDSLTAECYVPEQFREAGVPCKVSSSLQFLNLSSPDIGHIDLDFTDAKELRTLELYGGRCSFRFLGRGGDFGARGLRQLTLSRAKVGGLENFLSGLRKLEEISLNSQSLHSNQERTPMRFPRLKKIAFYQDTFPDGFLDNLVAPQLEVMDISDKEMGDMPDLLRHSPRLKSLHLVGGRWRAGENELGLISSLPQLEHLSLAFGGFPVEKLFQRISGCNGLKRLGIKTDSVFMVLPSTPSLQVQAISLDCPLSNLDGLLEWFRSLPQLKELEFGRGILPLVPSGIFFIEGLEELRLSGNVWLPSVLPSKCTLRSLDLRNGKIMNSEVLAQFREAFPELEILEAID